MDFWDITAGILIAAFLIVAMAYGLRDRHNFRGDRALGIMGVLFAVAIVVWRGNCWYGTIACDVDRLAKPTVHSLLEKYHIEP